MQPEAERGLLDGAMCRFGFNAGTASRSDDSGPSRSPSRFDIAA